MRSEFSWYLDAIAPDFDRIWKEGVLTLDANVLLDLYRYNTATCDSLLSAIGSFGERVWVSRQAASEFFANRKRVIAASGRDFDDAIRAVDELSKTTGDGLSKLRKLRLVPRQVVERLEADVAAALSKARDDAEAARGAHPEYLSEDPILDRILSTFEGRVGAGHEPDRRADLIKEAVVRFKEKRPPGYKDEDGKEGDRRYGDFLLWSETIEFAAGAKVPVVLVTSEVKEDWWERPSGQTLGPRMELVQEFHEATGQPILIYHTERFAQLAAERAGSSLKPDIAQEILEVSARRARPHPPAVDVEHLPQFASEEENYGTLEIELLREVRMMTGSGRLDPRMAGVPDVRATVTAAPAGCPPLYVDAATGTTFDFNVHVRPVERGRTMPVGRYVVEYECVYEAGAGSGKP